MKHITVVLALLILSGIGCKKESPTKDETNTTTSTTTNPTGFSDTITGKWKIIAYPKGWQFYGYNDFIVFYEASNAIMWNSHNLYDYTTINWYPMSDTINFYMGSANHYAAQTFKSNSEMKFDYKGELLHLKKVSDLSCPDITAVENKNEKELTFTGSFDLIQQKDITSNLTIESYSPTRGLCRFTSSVNMTGAYVTFKRKNCPALSYKHDLGIWKKQ
jgi:hypothetical protein